MMQGNWRRTLGWRRSTVLLWAMLALLAVAMPATAAGLSRPVVEKIRSTVVYISVELRGGDLDGEYESTGSGFLVSDEGHVVTNAHVVSYDVEGEDRRQMRAETREVTVTFHPATAAEQSVPAEVLRENADLDLALLKIDRPALPYLDLGDSDEALETTPIFVCGHPLGLPELSIRAGTVTSHRTWEQHRYLEHDAAAEIGNSGGPMVDEDGLVVGVHTMTLGKAGAPQGCRFAIPSNVVAEWLRSDPSQDTPTTTIAQDLEGLLRAADLVYQDEGDGVFRLPYEEDTSVYIHQYKEFVRAFAGLGNLGGDSALERGQAAMKALSYNWLDPIGRFSAWEDEEGALRITWECQIPRSAATPDFIRFVTDNGAGSVGGYLKGEMPRVEFQGGDNEALRSLLDQAKLIYEWNEEAEVFQLPYDNNVTVRVHCLGDLVRTFCWVGGMPGRNERQQGEAAIWMLMANWDDPFGRLSRDQDNDICWESQVPLSAMTPDYLVIVAATCATQAQAYIDEFGQVPLNG